MFFFFVSLLLAKHPESGSVSNMFYWVEMPINCRGRISQCGKLNVDHFLIVATLS